MSTKPHIFRAVKGRNYHYSDTPVRSDREDSEAIAICGARFERWYVYHWRTEPTCPGCLAALIARNEAERSP